MSNPISRNSFRIEISSFAQLPVSQAGLRRFVAGVLKALNIRRAHLSFLFLDDRGISKFNAEIMKHSGPTDVISISQLETRSGRKEPNPLNSLGDIIISVERSRREARLRKIPAQEEFFRYVVHGILHCLGYNDIRNKEREKMWLLQEGLLASVLKIKKLS